jgi:hypothetical protein
MSGGGGFSWMAGPSPAKTPGTGRQQTRYKGLKIVAEKDKI